MLGIEIDHIGIRVREKFRSTDFCEFLGFEPIVDPGFEQGHPIMMRHHSGIVLNFLGPSTEEQDENILMDQDRRFAGYTHMALKIESLSDAELFFADWALQSKEQLASIDAPSRVNYAQGGVPK